MARLVSLALAAGILALALAVSLSLDSTFASPPDPTTLPAACKPRRGMTQSDCNTLRRRWESPVGTCRPYATPKIPAAVWTSTHCNLQMRSGGCRLWYQCSSSTCKRTCTANPYCSWTATESPTAEITSSPSPAPPTLMPTEAPVPTEKPTRRPSRRPNAPPTRKPTRAPTKRPTTRSPTRRPTFAPTTSYPTLAPTAKDERCVYTP